MTSTFAICGCGWLGQPLAQHWLRQGHQVIGTTRDEQNATRLTKMGIQAQLFKLGQPLPGPVADADVTVLNIPPGRRNLDPEPFRTKMEDLLAQLQHRSRVLFISTSSVFGQAQGDVDETSPVKPDSASGELHCQLEDYIRQHFGERASVLRLAGLIGGERHPAKMLAGRSLKEGQRPVNLIHRDDVVQAIDRIVKQSLFGQTFHLSANDHPSREDFYTWATHQAGLTPPNFQSDQTTGKVIHSLQTQKRLGLTLSYPSPYDMPVPSGN